MSSDIKDDDILELVLIHGGYKHRESKIILEYMDNKNIEGITRICVSSEKIKNMILNNKKGLKVKYIPSIIIKKGNEKPEIFKGSKEMIRDILDELSNLNDESSESDINDYESLSSE